MPPKEENFSDRLRNTVTHDVVVFHDGRFIEEPKFLSPEVPVSQTMMKKKKKSLKAQRKVVFALRWSRERIVITRAEVKGSQVSRDRSFSVCESGLIGLVRVHTHPHTVTRGGSVCRGSGGARSRNRRHSSARFPASD